MSTNLSTAPPADTTSSEVPRKIALVRPNPNEGNPLLARRAPRRPAEKRVLSTVAGKPSEIKAQRLGNKWAALSSTVATASQEVKATPINDADWASYRLVTTKASVLKGLRHHVIRMHPKRFDQIPDPQRPGETIGVPRKVDLLNPNEFGRPIKLHRRDPSAPLGGMKESEAARVLAAQQAPVYDEEKEARDLERTQRAAEKAEIESKIAPYGAAAKKRSKFAKKTEQVFRHDTANAKMRYEESQPWFIEDFDNTNTWQGQREQNMSNGTFVALVHGDDDMSMRMIPIEKWYKFRQVNKFKLSVEEATAVKKRLDEVPSWMKVVKVKKEEDEQLTAAEQALYNKNMRHGVKRVFTTKGAEDVKPDREEIDYDDDRFDNDDAGQVYGFDGDDDEERKEIEKRIKKEQLSANALGVRDERLYDAEKAKQMKLAIATKKHGKRTKKVLRKREGNYNYNSDSDSNPYASSEESEDEEEVLRLAETRKKEVDAKLKAEEDKKAAEAAKEAKRLSDLTEKKLKAAAKRKETAKKKVEKVQNVGKSSTIPTTLIALGGKQKEAPNATPITTTPITTPASLGVIPSNKRSASFITDSDECSEEGPPLKRPNTNNRADKTNNSTKAKGPNEIMMNNILIEPPTAKISTKAVAPNGVVVNDGLMRPPAARVNNNNTKVKTPNGVAANNTLIEPPVMNNREKKRKPDEIQSSEALEVKKQKVQHENRKRSLSPPPTRAITPALPVKKTSVVPKAPTAAVPITDEDLKALLRSNPQGVTVKFITTAFRGRMLKGDIHKMVDTMKRVGKIIPGKGLWVIKDEFK